MGDFMPLLPILDRRSFGRSSIYSPRPLLGLFIEYGRVDQLHMAISLGYPAGGRSLIILATASVEWTDRLLWYSRWVR